MLFPICWPEQAVPFQTFLMSSRMVDSSAADTADARVSRLTVLGILMTLLSVGCFSLVRSLTETHQLLCLLLVVVAVVPLVRVHTGSIPSPQQDYFQAYARLFPVIAIALLLLTAVCYLLTMREAVGDVDLFYFLCYARDMNLGGDIPENAYSYFPGIYTFWRFAILISGDSLPALQAWHLGTIVLNCLLISLLLWRLTRSLPAALFSAGWALLLYSRFQGLGGTSEPLATIPLLAALCYWNGESMRGQKGILSCLALGVGFGLALYGKQQAGLLSLGALLLLAESLGHSTARRHDLRILVILPVLALLTLLVAILAEGKGMAPLWKGLSIVSSYGQEGSWLHNLYVQVRRDETAALATLFAAGTLCWWGLEKKTRTDSERRQLSVAGLLAISGLATLIQLRSRGFHHYMLLAVPSLVVSSTLAWLHLWSRRAETWRSLKIPCLALLLAPLVPFLFSSGIDKSFLAARLPRPVEAATLPHLHQKLNSQNDLEQIRQHVAPGTSILLVPARHNSIHFLLQTSSSASTGYHFQLQEYIDGSWIDQLSAGHRYVVVQFGGLDETDRKSWGRIQQRRTHRTLLNQNYEVLVEGRYLVLYGLRD